MRAGYSANAKVGLKRADNVMRVSESVVEFSGDSTFVYCLVDSVPVQTFRRTPIVTGVSDGINIEVKSGIDSNVLLRGQEKESSR
ncbi:MAG: efflux transporter periplasmic adaptor subunit, partial [Paramuribaculum sp.]|nr:efflux transporter periplasmic adaptor subunit [Paramuribaculum sp.]